MARTLQVTVLGSGSQGNAILVASGADLVLVDCGFSAREVATRMTACGHDPADLTALLLTHEHSDHIRGVDVLVRRHAARAAVYATSGTSDSLSPAARERLVPTRAGDSFRIGSLTVAVFRTSHDAAEPTGFRIDAESGGSFGIASDTGVLTEEAVEALHGVEILGLESNHDIGMLRRGRYPWSLKQRILSEYGHLSNADASAAIPRLASDRMRVVIGLHRSMENNTPDLARCGLENALRDLAHSARVEIASQSEAVSVD